MAGFLCVLGTLCVLCAAAGCGKSGPPLPPLIKVPVAPPEFAAARRADRIELQFIVPNANTDGTRPANVERVDIYAYTGPAEVNDQELIKRATKVANVAVKKPRDPNATIEPDEPAGDMEPLEGIGLNQGEKARVSETLTPAVLVPLEARLKPKKNAEPAEGPLTGVAASPLLGPPPLILTRAYVGVGVAANGRRGPFTARIAVPLAPPPPPPAAPKTSYDEKALTVSWSAPAMLTMLAPATGDTLPATPVWSPAPTLAYNVYEVPPPDAERKPSDPLETRLNASPLTEFVYTDSRMTWGAERCYAIRTVESVNSTNIESDAVQTDCVTLRDTFAPLAPKDLKSVVGERSISLIWQPNDEKDLAGYIILRGPAGSDPVEPVSQTIQDTNFTDQVPTGVRYAYAVVAVDKAGNRSAPSVRVEETAR